MTTIAVTVSRLRNTIKAVRSDAFITDRFLYSLVLKYATLFIKEQHSIEQLLRFTSLFRTIPCIELVDSNKVAACCDVKSDCPIKRTKEKIPLVMEAAFGPIFRTVSSIDGSIELFPTTPGTYSSMTKTSTWKYNKNKYYWLLDQYLYIPDIEYDQIKIDAVWTGDLNGYTCGEDQCVLMQDQPTPIPDYIFAKAEQFVLKDLGMTYQLPEDPTQDKQNLLR